MRYQQYVVLSICLLAGTAGCGGTNFGPMGSVSGKLTMDGAPLDAGTQVLFMQMEKGYAAFGQADAEGNYRLKWMREGQTFTEVPVGTYKILIQPPATQNVEELDADAMLAGGDEDLEPATAVFPAKYQQHATSGLEFTVSEGANAHDINLDSNAK